MGSKERKDDTAEHPEKQHTQDVPAAIRRLVAVSMPTLSARFAREEKMLGSAGSEKLKDHATVI